MRLNKIYKITIPFLPPSVNEMYANNFKKNRKGRYATQKLMHWQQISKLFVDYQELITTPVNVEIHLYFKDKLRRDTSNYIKAVEDILPLKDDSQVMRISAEKFVDKDNTRTEVIIFERS